VYTLIPIVLSLRRVDTVNEYRNQGYSRTYWGRRLVPGGLKVPALDRNQTPLPFPSIFLACLSVLLHAHKGVDPRQELIIPYYSFDLVPAHSTLLHHASVHSTSRPSMLALIPRCAASPLYHAPHAFTYYYKNLPSNLHFFLNTNRPHNLLLSLSLFHTTLGLQVTIENHYVRCTAAQAGGRAPG
jgi:hypothetical protein